MVNLQLKVSLHIYIHLDKSKDRQLYNYELLKWIKDFNPRNKMKKRIFEHQIRYVFAQNQRIHRAYILPFLIYLYTFLVLMNMYVIIH